MSRYYFLIEPKYSYPNTLCRFEVGSQDTQATVHVYADMWMLNEVATALMLPSLRQEVPQVSAAEDASDEIFDFLMTVLPHQGGNRHLRFQVFQDWRHNGAPYRADMVFELTPAEAETLARALQAWCKQPDRVFEWRD